MALEQLSLFDTPSEIEDCNVPLVAVKACQPLHPLLGSGWVCLLACGCEAQVPVGPRPRRVPHRCTNKETPNE